MLIKIIIKKNLFVLLVITYSNNNSYLLLDATILFEIMLF